MNSADFDLVMEQVTWWGLLFTGVQFLVVGSRLREDKTFLFLGSTLFLVCAFGSVDVWVLIPSTMSRLNGRALDAFHLAQQMAACATVLALYRFTRELAGKPSRRFIALNDVLAGLFSLVAAIDIFHPALLFSGISNGMEVVSPFYAWVFVPWCCASALVIIFWSAAGTRRAPPAARKTLALMCVGYAAILVGGMLDFFSILNPDVLTLPSFVIFGETAFGAICTYIFADHLLRLYGGQRQALLEAARVGEALEAHQPLREIGLSATLVSREIGENISELKTNVQKMKQEGFSEYRAELTRIDSARAKLEALTRGILDYARSTQVSPGPPTRIGAILARCLRNRLPEFAGRVSLWESSEAGPFPMDAFQMERALLELLKNAFEAGASTVKVRIRQGAGLALIAIEDDGGGAPREVLEGITGPFFTTRKRQGRCGLGASIADGIIRGHGGTLRYYAHRRGLLINVLLPLSEKSPLKTGEPRGECLLVSDGAGLIKAFSSVCGNLGLRPSILGSARTRDIRKWTGRSRWLVLHGEAAARALSGAGPADANRRARIQGRSLLIEEEENGEPGGILCEETLLQLLGSAS